MTILFVSCHPTFPVRHAVKEAPGRLGRVSTPDKGDVVRGLDTDHSHQLHVDPDTENHYVKKELWHKAHIL